MTNNQEIFDKVAKHLLTQRKRSGGDLEWCLYRNGDLKCAIGCLIPDEVYNDKMEGYSVRVLLDQDKKFLGFLVTDETLELLEELQFVHDTISVGDWVTQLKDVSDKFNLSFNEELYK